MKMKHFLYDILISPFKERSFLSYIFGVFIWASTLFLLGIFLYFLVWVADSSFLPEKQSQGVVVEKYYVPEHTTTTYTQVGEVFIPVTNYYSEEYNIVITIDGISDKVSLSISNYNNINIGDKLCCIYTSGRILDSIYIQDFCH